MFQFPSAARRDRRIFERFALPVLEIVMVMSIVTLWSAPVWRGWPKPPTGLDRLRRMCEVRTALELYYADHGTFPTRLSQLHPQYVPANRLDLWFPSRLEAWFPNRVTLPANLPAALLDMSRLDENCDYLYFPKVPIVGGTDVPFRALGVLVCDRFTPSRPNDQYMAICNNRSAQIMTRAQLDDALARTAALIKAADESQE